MKIVGYIGLILFPKVTHTNDLTALALTNSALHNLAIPHIYSRFDIVWPDATSTTDTRTGVDALTYGLATLVMGHDVLSQCCVPEAHSNGSTGHSFRCTKCGAEKFRPTSRGGQRRLGNHYPQYTRKFSLGNGPADWVQEYMITKESGKMLGTLVALAVARMINLESFIWDMPTGVLRDVWLALASLQYKCPPGECRLERLLVRWHDNSSESLQAAPNTTTNSNTTPIAGQLTSIGIMVPSGANATSQSNQSQTTIHQSGPQNRVECPTLSVLPPLKSLSVLDIDELAYLDEMSVLIAKSKDRLQELRVGIAKKAGTREFVLAWDGPGLQQVDHNAKWPGAPNTIGERRLGGVLGILLGRVFDIRKKPKLVIRSQAMARSTAPAPVPQLHAGANSSTQQESPVAGSTNGVMLGGLGSEEQIMVLFPVSMNGEEHLPQGSGFLSTTSTPVENVQGADLGISATITSPGTEFVQPQPVPTSHPISPQPRPACKDSTSTNKTETFLDDREYLDGKLRLRVLELERVPLSIAVLQKGFDWPMITSLTILDCAYHESLWKMLRKYFQPQIAPRSALATSSMIRHSISANSASKTIPHVPLEYQLNLKKIHTDFATQALIQFLKETLAPNTLEVLFLQDRRRNTAPSVTINDIYRGPLKRHRRSLKKLLIDSSDRIPKGPSAANRSVRWRTWLVNHEVLTYLTSGSMISLRELSIAIEYKDWVSYQGVRHGDVN